jgi:hypothetical protein
VGNTAVPNFVYRFTEREIIKVVHCYAPYAKPDIHFFHPMRIRGFSFGGAAIGRSTTRCARPNRRFVWWTRSRRDGATTSLR